MAKKWQKILPVKNKALPLYPQSENHTRLHFFATVAQLVERDLAKVEVAGPSPVCRSRFKTSLSRWRNW